MKKITADINLVASCGLYCGACTRFLKEKCPGCRENDKAIWCKVRTCNIENGYGNCSECEKYDDINQCGDFDNFISRIFSFIFRSNRKRCVEYIKENGADAFARLMAVEGRHSFKRE
jgi:hypothetical protein